MSGKRGRAEFDRAHAYAPGGGYGGYGDDDDGDGTIDDPLDYDLLDAVDEHVDFTVADDTASDSAPGALSVAELDALEAKDAAMRASWTPMRAPMEWPRDYATDGDRYMSAVDFSYGIDSARGLYVKAYGTLLSGHSALVKIFGRNHSFLVQMPRIWTMDNMRAFYEKLAEKTRNSVLYQMGKRKIKPGCVEHQHLLDECFGGAIKQEGEFFRCALKKDAVDAYANVLRGYDIEYALAGKEYRDKRDDTPRAYMRVYTRYPCIARTIKTKIDACLGGKTFSGDTELKPWLPYECALDPNEPWDKPCTFEHDLKYVEYMALQAKIHPIEWFRLPAHKYQRIEGCNAESTCQIELAIDYTDIVGVLGTEEREALPLTASRLCSSFDIETELGPYSEELKRHVFGSPLNQRCLIIGQELYETNNQETCRCVHFGLGDIKKIDNAECYTWEYTEEGERRMLLAWRRYMLLIDPDAFDSYNGENFDFYFLLTRARVLGIERRFTMFSRSLDVRDRVTTRELVFKDRGKGTRENRSTRLVGRMHFDFLRIVRNEYGSIRDKSLNGVAWAKLGMRKHDIDIQKLPEMMRSLEGRTELAIYCLRDCKLPRLLKIKLGKDPEYSAMARLTDVTMQDIMYRGQQTRGFRLLTREMHADNYVMPDEMGGRKVDYTGAVVLKTRPGLYRTIVATNDFSSLYPSCIMENNLCYTTVLSWETIEREQMVRGEFFDFERQCVKEEYLPMPEDNDPETKKFSFLRYVARINRIEERDKIDYYVVMDFDDGGEGRDYWVRFKPGKTASPFFAFRRRLGVLVRAEIETLIERNRVKGLMKAHDESSFTYKVLDGRQLAVKLVGNSLYGFTSANMRPDSRIAFATTHAGQGHIRLMRYNAQKLITVANGFACDLVVISGDTDSIMYWLPGVTSDDEVNRIGKAIEEGAKSWVRPPHTFAFEKYAYRSIFSDKKKRNAMYMREAGKEKTFLKVTGYESKRLDNCVLLPEVQMGFLRDVLVDDNMDAGKKRLRDAVRDLVNDDVRYDKLIISRKYAKAYSEYADAEKQPHINLAKRLTERDPDNAPRAGDSIQYIIRPPMHKTELASSCTEEPFYAFENNIPIDVDYYLRMIEEPMERILTVCGVSSAEVHDIFHGAHARKRKRSGFSECPPDVLATLVGEQERRVQAQHARPKTARAFNAPKRACGTRKTAFERLSEKASGDTRQKSVAFATAVLARPAAPAAPTAPKQPSASVSAPVADIEDLVAAAKGGKPRTPTARPSASGFKQVPLVALHVRRCQACHAPCRRAEASAAPTPLCVGCNADDAKRNAYIAERRAYFLNEIYTPFEAQMKACFECKGEARTWPADVHCVARACPGLYERMGRKRKLRDLQKEVGSVFGEIFEPPLQ